MLYRVKSIFTCILVISLGITACGNNNRDITGKQDSTKSAVNAAKSSEVQNSDNVIKIPDEKNNSKEISVRSRKITVYSIENDKVVPKTSVVMDNDKVKPETIIESVMLELDDVIDGDITTEVTEDGDSIIVNFNVSNKDYPFGEKIQVPETSVLECISYSILDNFKEYKKIYFKLNGEAYVSKQLKLADGKPFMVNE